MTDPHMLDTPAGKIPTARQLGDILRGGIEDYDPELVTIAAGVATLTKSDVILAAESGTTDQLDSIVFPNARPGTRLTIRADVGDTITLDNANFNLGAATRAVGPGGSITMEQDVAGEWTEQSFVAGTDNVD
jgi:hypothetical protein